MKKLCQLGPISVALTVVVFGISLVFPTPLLAKFPEKPITIIVPVGTGGVTDITSRVFAKHLSRVWGVTVNVVNKAGGSTIIATLELNNSKTDGYTVMMDSRDATSMPYALENLPFNILDRTWMNTIADNAYLLAVPYNSKYQNLQEVINAMRSDPTHFRIPSIGGIGTQDFFGRQFAKAIGVDYKKLNLVIGKGGGDIVLFTIQGSVDVGMFSTSVAKPQIEAKKIRALAVTGRKRVDWLPELPTFEELGYPQVNAVFWIGLSGPPGLPKAIVDTWNETVKKLLLEDKECQADLDKLGMTPRYRNQQEVVEYVKEQMEISRQVWGAEK